MKQYFVHLAINVDMNSEGLFFIKTKRTCSRIVVKAVKSTEAVRQRRSVKKVFL